MLSPKRIKWRRQHRGGYSGFATRGERISFGDYALVCMERGRLSARQIEACRVAVSRSVKRGGKLWIRVFPSLPITKKPAEVRMGKGKGSPEYWVTKIQPGRIVLEIGGVSKEKAKEAFRLAGHKLPLKTKFLARSGL